MTSPGRILMWFGVHVLILNEYFVMLQKHGPNAVRINKCCEKNEILIDLLCTPVNQTSGESYDMNFRKKIKKFVWGFKHFLCSCANC